MMTRSYRSIREKHRQGLAFRQVVAYNRRPDGVRIRPPLAPRRRALDLYAAGNRSVTSSRRPPAAGQIPSVPTHATAPRFCPISPFAALEEPSEMSFFSRPLTVAAGLDAWPLVAAVAVFMTASAAYGTRWFIFSRPWPFVRRWFSLSVSELEHELPPRFAQALGATFLVLGSLLLAAGLRPWGWLPVAGVVALQTLLAGTGFCLGCRLFFLRWYVPDLFARLVGRGVRREALILVD